MNWFSAKEKEAERMEEVRRYNKEIKTGKFSLFDISPDPRKAESLSGICFSSICPVSGIARYCAGSLTEPGAITC